MADNTVQLRALLASIAALPDALNKALNTRTAPNSLKLAGKTLAEIQAAIKTATDADIKVVSDLLATFMARTDNPHQVTKAQVGLDKVDNFATATAEQGIAGTAANLFLTPAVLKSALDAFWSGKVGSAPETLDTINEIAAALNNDPDVVKNLTTLVGANKTAIKTLKSQVEGLSTSLDGRLDVLETASADYATRVTALESNKLDKTAQAADSKLFEGKTLAQVIAQASDGNTEALQELSARLDAFIAAKASSTEVVTGTDDAKYVTAKGVKAATDAAIAALVDGAPAALDTLKELATRLTEEGDALAALVTTVDGKLGKTEQAADSAKLEGKTLAEVLAAAKTSADAGDAVLDGRLDTVEADITSLKADDAAVDGRLDSAETRLTALESADTALDGRLDTLETDNTSTKSRLTALESGETAADGRLDALEPRVAANETDIAALKTGKLDKTGQAADSKLLEGKTVAQISEAITGGSTETLKALRDALDAFIANKATSEEAVAGTDNSKYITAVGLKAATDSAIAALVDGAPTALDTLKELADKLTQEGDALAALVTQVDQKLDKTAQAADSKLLEGKTAAQVIEGLATQNDLQLAVDKMTRSFEDAVDEIDGVSRLRAQLTVATLDTDQFGYDDDKGGLTPNTLFDSTIVTLDWDVSDKKAYLEVNGDHTSEDVRQLILNDLVSSNVSSAVQSGVTVFTFTFDDLSTLPTTGTLPVAVRYA